MTPFQEFTAKWVQPPTQYEVLTTVFIILAILLAVGILRMRKSRRPWKPRDNVFRFGSRAPSREPDEPNLADPKAQMDAVAAVQFERVPLLNREEARLLPVLEAAVRQWGKGHRLMAQVSLGEVIRPRDGLGTAEARRRGFASINSKRLDFAVIDRFGMLCAAIEYQGSGHYTDRTFLRDAIKREALRKAGVEMIEIAAPFHPEEVKARMQRVLSGSDHPAGR